MQISLSHPRRPASHYLPGATFAEPLTSAPGEATALRAHHAPDSEKPASEWNTCDIVCRSDTIEVTVNGVRQNKITRCAPAAGRVGFQLEGTPFELRHVRIEPLRQGAWARTRHSARRSRHRGQTPVVEPPRL